MRRQSCREAKHSAAAGAVVSALCRRSTVDNRQFVTSGVNRGSCSNVAAVCYAHRPVCSSIRAVCFDFLRSFGLNAITRLGWVTNPVPGLLIIVS